MVAFTFRMQAGIPGEVSRFQTLGTTISQELQNNATPVTEYGVPVIINNSGVRPVIATDLTADAEVGFTVRPFPGGDITVAFPGGSVPFGSGTPAARGIIDVLRRGFMSVQLGGSAAPQRQSSVWVWTAASSGAHVQGHVESVDPTTSGFKINRAFFRGPADAQGNTEIGYNI
jgi:hypothetical protein